MVIIRENPLTVGLGRVALSKKDQPNQKWGAKIKRQLLRREGINDTSNERKTCYNNRVDDDAADHRLS